MFRLLPCFCTPADNAEPDFSSSKSFIRDAWKNETGLFPFFSLSGQSIGNGTSRLRFRQQNGRTIKNQPVRGSRQAGRAKENKKRRVWKVSGHGVSP